jgi:hypothetical protein
MGYPFPDRSLLRGSHCLDFRPWRLPGHGAKKQYIALHKNVKTWVSQRKSPAGQTLNGLAMAVA